MKKLVILGSGFGAFSCLKELDNRLYEITVVSPRNHFLFTPLLPATTVGTVEFRSIIEPARSAQRDMHFYQATCSAVDLDRRTITCVSTGAHGEFSLPFDKLVIAVGGES